jgi:hypothetical protein
MEHKRFVFRPLLAAFFVTLAQLFVAVVLIAPSGPISWRYTTLIQHDSFWFANIVDRGYDTTVPPISHKMMEVSNVAFFPAYPAWRRRFKYGLHFSTYNALLVTAQAPPLVSGATSSSSANAGISRRCFSFGATAASPRIRQHSFSSPVTPSRSS